MWLRLYWLIARSGTTRIIFCENRNCKKSKTISFQIPLSLSPSLLDHNILSNWGEIKSFVKSSKRSLLTFWEILLQEFVEIKVFIIRKLFIRIENTREVKSRKGFENFPFRIFPLKQKSRYLWKSLKLFYFRKLFLYLNC